MMRKCLSLGAGSGSCLSRFGSNTPFFSSVVSSPPALGYEAASVGDPPEPDARDGSLSDDLALGGVNEGVLGPEEPLEGPVGPEKHATVSELLDGSYDTDALMDTFRGQVEGRDSEFDMEVVPTPV